MTTYYLSTAGSDSNNGLGPDASHASNKPFLTMGKLLAAGSAVLAPGDTAYVGPGYYYSSGNITVSTGFTGATVQIIGDPSNAQGFKDGSGVPLAPGLCWLTTRTSGEGLDSPIASTSNFLNMATNDPIGLQFYNLVLEVSVSSNAGICGLDLNGSTDLLLQDCRLIFGASLFGLSNTAGTAARNWTARRCVCIGGAIVGGGTTPNTAAATADADMNIVVEECFVLGARAVAANQAFSASGGNLAGGVYFYDNTFVGSGVAATTAARISTVKPIVFTGNLFISNASTFNAGTSGQITDGGYNRIISGQTGSNFTNVTQAGTTFISVAANLALPDLMKYGLEMPRRDFLGWTDAAAAAQAFSASGRTTADFRGRTVRPWKDGSSIGCMQALGITQDTSSAITGGGVNSMKLTGAGEHSEWIAVDAVGFTVSVTTKSTSYGGTNYPQLCVCATPSVGVTADTTVTASDGTEQTITTATITPTSKGVMEVRLISRSTSTTSVTYFDLLRSP